MDSRTQMGEVYVWPHPPTSISGTGCGQRSETFNQRGQHNTASQLGVKFLFHSLLKIIVQYSRILVQIMLYSNQIGFSCVPIRQCTVYLIYLQNVAGGEGHRSRKKPDYIYNTSDVWLLKSNYSWQIFHSKRCTRILLVLLVNSLHYQPGHFSPEQPEANRWRLCAACTGLRNKTVLLWIFFQLM